MITAPTLAAANTETATSGHMGMKMPMRSPCLTPSLRNAPASRDTWLSSSLYVSRRTSPGSPSQMIASLPAKSPSR